MGEALIRRLADLIAVLVVSVLAAALALAGWPAGPLRAIFGVPAVLFTPGYAIAALAVPNLKISPWERLMLSLGISLAVAVLGGLLLQIAGLSLRPTSWILLLVLVTAATVALAAWRREKAIVSQRGPLRSLILPSMAGLLMLVGLVPFALEARQSASTQPRPAFTQLWLVPPQPGAGKPARIGVRNWEGKATSYLVEVQASPLTSVVLPVRLNPSASWETTIPAGQAPSGAPLEVRLYRANDTQKVYRRVALPTGAAVMPR